MFCLASSFIFCQVKSSNIQTISGVKYYIHKIEKGQSLYSISKLYNVNLNEIYLLNPEVKSGARANQEIKIPFKNSSVNTATVAGSSSVSLPSQTLTASNTILPVDTNLYYTHRVLKKETIYSISKKFGITEAELKILNPILISQGPKEGQVIIVGEKQAVTEQDTLISKAASINDSVNPNIIHRPKKSKYEVALMLPFELDLTLNTDLTNLVKTRSNFPLVPSYAVDFYLGFMKAADSLKANDFEVNINLYDINDKDSLKLAQAANDTVLKRSDFIFGPFHASGFKTISQTAKEAGIPIVSPITQQNKMLYDNIYVSKTNPSQFTLMESLAEYCIDSLAVNNANIILAQLSGVDSRELTYVKAFKKYYNDRQKELGKLPKDTVALAKGLAGVKNLYNPNVKNVVIILSTNQVLIADFITQLAIFGDKKDITLCGWQSVGATDNIDQEYLNQLNFTFPHQYNLTNAGGYESIINSYKEQQYTYPGDYYFIGFDIGLYYLSNLKLHGSDFIFNLHELPYETNYMRFKFKRPDNLTGFDNRGVYIFRYNNYQLQKTGWK